MLGHYRFVGGLTGWCKPTLNGSSIEIRYDAAILSFRLTIGGWKEP